MIARSPSRYTSIARVARADPSRVLVCSGDVVRVEWPNNVAWVRVLEAWERVSHGRPELGIVVGRMMSGRWICAITEQDGVRITGHVPATDEVRSRWVRRLAHEAVLGRGHGKSPDWKRICVAWVRARFGCDVRHDVADAIAIAAWGARAGEVLERLPKGRT